MFCWLIYVICHFCEPNWVARVYKIDLLLYLIFSKFGHMCHHIVSRASNVFGPPPFAGMKLLGFAPLSDKMDLFVPQEAIKCTLWLTSRDIIYYWNCKFNFINVTLTAEYIFIMIFTLDINSLNKFKHVALKKSWKE